MENQSARSDASPGSPASGSKASEAAEALGQAGSAGRPAHPAGSPFGRTARVTEKVRVLRPRSRRCSERGCVFPVSFISGEKCLYHHLEALEPGFFESTQPTLSMLDQAKFGLPDGEPDDSRVVDRNRQAAQRVAFLLEEAA